MFIYAITFYLRTFKINFEIKKNLLYKKETIIYAQELILLKSK